MRLTVLYYHEVVPEGKGYSYQKIETKKFEEQMQFLKEQGYETVTFEDLHKPLPKKPIVITFDDGFKTVKEYAIPVLKKYGFKATLFLAPHYINEDHDYYLSWDDLRELVKDNLVSIGSHTYTHIDVRTASKQKLIEELENCDSSIERQLGIQSQTFCFPYGACNKSAISYLREYGKYKYLVASFFGQTNVKKLTSRLVQRVGISDEDTIEMFQRKVKGKENYRGIVHLYRLFVSNIKKKYVTEYRIDF